jgi:hypothetical protein
MGMEHEETTEWERNVDVVIKTFDNELRKGCGVCIGTTSTRSAGSREGEVVYERLGVLLLIDKSSYTEKKVDGKLRQPDRM